MKLRISNWPAQLQFRMLLHDDPVFTTYFVRSLFTSICWTRSVKVIYNKRHGFLSGAANYRKKQTFDCSNCALEYHPVAGQESGQFSRKFSRLAGEHLVPRITEICWLLVLQSLHYSSSPFFGRALN